MVEIQDFPPLPPENQNTYFHLAALLGARPDMPNRNEYLCFLTASVVFILGTLGFLGYIYLEPLRRNMAQAVLSVWKGCVLPLSSVVPGGLYYLSRFSLWMRLFSSWSLPLEVAGGYLVRPASGCLIFRCGTCPGWPVAFFSAAG